MRLLVTGGLGFIGSNFILSMLKTYQDLSVTNLDLITYAGNLENLVDVKITEIVTLLSRVTLQIKV